MKYFFVFLVATGLLHAEFIRDNILETVYDNETNLTWQDNKQVAEGRYVWGDAIDYCENLVFSGKEDWRVPNINELFSIVSQRDVDPTIDTSVFKNIASFYYWSSTTNAGNTNLVWNIYFNQGHASTCTRGHVYYVRCVRGVHNDVSFLRQPNSIPIIYYLLD